VHEIRRDVLIRTLRDLGATTPPAQPAYLPPAPVRTPPQARALAVHIEDACVAAYATILSAGDSTARVRTIGWLEDSAVRAMRWRLNLGPSSIAAAPPLPGLATPNP
jgi:hypothetical protein